MIVSDKLARLSIRRLKDQVSGELSNRFNREFYGISLRFLVNLQIIFSASPAFLYIYYMFILHYRK